MFEKMKNENKRLLDILLCAVFGAINGILWRHGYTYMAIAIITTLILMNLRKGAFLFDKGEKEKNG